MIERKHWQAAMDSQCACNLSGIVHSYSKVMTVIWDEANRVSQGTDWVNTHPIAVLYATQVGHLTGVSICGDTEVYGKAHAAVEAALKEEVSA